MFPLLHLSLCDELESFQTVSQANLSSLFIFFHSGIVATDR